MLANKGNNNVKNNRVKFEPSDKKKCVVENEFCKIYLDSVSHQTFKVIDDYVVPIELKELNMWKNRQKNPRDFSVETIKDENGEIFDFVITKNVGGAAASKPDVSSAPVTETSVQPIKESPAKTAASPSVASPEANTTKTENKPRKRKPKSTRLSKCAICKNEFKEEDLLLFVNRNYCYGCVEEAVKEKVQGFPVDPVEKAILDITTADEIYCTYSSVTNYPYIDENNCVNICSVSRVAESVIDGTTVETIEDKGAFFDELKRFGMNKIIVNGDSSHIFNPSDFDEHVKSDGIAAADVFFDIVKYYQSHNNDVAYNVASKFLSSTVYTLSSDSDITEITEQNIDNFSPITLSDGYSKYCLVFTDLTEARSVNISFKGIYSIKASLLPNDDTDYYIINPASLGYTISKSSLDGIEPYKEPILETPIIEYTPLSEGSPEPEKIAEMEINSIFEDKASDIPAAEEELPVEEPTVVAEAPAEEPAVVAEAPAEEPAAVEEAPAEEPAVVEEAPAEEPAAVEETTAEEPAAVAEIPVEESAVVEEASIEEPDGEPQPDSDAIIDNVIEEAVATPNIEAIVQELAAENSPVATIELSGLSYESSHEEATDEKTEEEIPVEEAVPIKSIQEQIVETNLVLSNLHNNTTFENMSALRREVDDKMKELSGMIVKAPALYAQFDRSTGHIFIDGNNRGHIFSDLGIAEKSNEMFRSKGIELLVQEYTDKNILTMVYEYKRHGIQDLVLDEGANWIIISTDNLADELDFDDTDFIRIPITNPELMFSMTTLFQKMQSKIDYPTKKAEISSLERRMIREFTSSRYILPLIEADGGEIRPIILESRNGTNCVLVFSDVYEMKRFFGSKISIVKDYKLLSYNEMIQNFSQLPNTVIVLNEGSLRFEFNPYNCQYIEKVINS